MTPEHQRGTPKDEYFITDVAYCEQAVILIKQAKLPQNNSQRRKEDGTLPVSTQTVFTSHTHFLGQLQLSEDFWGLNMLLSAL